MDNSSPPPPPTGLLYRVDGESLNTLIEKYENSLSTNASEQERLEKLRQEYLSLKSRLTTLPQQLEYNALVPLGRRALCPGKIIHTNEIMCLLGDNWFAECSALKAVELVNHRIAKVDEQYEGLRKERELINNWKQEAERQLVETIGEGTVEIREDYDEEHEKRWRMHHRESVRRHHQQLAKERLEAKQEKSQIDDEMWSRLDELELQEDLENYVNSEPSIPEEIPVTKKHAWICGDADKKHEEKRPQDELNNDIISRENQKEKTETMPAIRPSRMKRVKFSADNIIHDISNDVVIENQESYNQERLPNSSEVGFPDDETIISSYPCFEPIMIRFRHSCTIDTDGEKKSAFGTEEIDYKSQVVSSPGDIVKVFGPTSISAISSKPQPKSILKPFAAPLVVADKRSKKAQGKVSAKKKVTTSLDGEDDDDDIDIESITPMAKVVTERVPIFTNLQFNTPNPTINEPEMNASKPVSLFKMRRQQYNEVPSE